MNLWIAGLNTPAGFSKEQTNDLTEILLKRLQTFPKKFEYQKKHVHYISFTIDTSPSERQYNYQNGRLSSYSGLIIDKHGHNNDYRNAKSLPNRKQKLSEIAKDLSGQFALVESTEDEFRCVVDAVGIYKVFYYESSQGDIYVSNYLPFIQLFKKVEKHLPFLIDFINNGGTYGYSTIEKNVFTLPENGELLWTKENGLTITSYENFKDFFLPSKKISLSELAFELANESAYLSEKHEVLLPLSGGFDSRTILNMFSGKNSRNITAFTYPDHPYDLKIAKKISGEFGISHVELKPKKIPDVDKLHKFAIKNFPLACYSTVFDYLFYDQKQTLYNWDKVEIRGNGGDTDLGIKKFGNLAQIPGDQAIQILAKKLINTNLLTQYGVEISKKSFIDHYSGKYLDLISEIPAFNLSTAHFIFERFASYQGHKYSPYILEGKNDLFLPFADRDYIKLLFSSASDQLLRGKKDSIHHQLTTYFTNGHTKPTPFTTSVHWNATKFDRIKYHLKRKYIDKTLAKLHFNQQKFSSKIRLEFLYKNASQFQDVIYSCPKSDIWEYIDRKKMIRVFENPEKLSQNMKSIFRVVPLLKEGI